MVVKPNPFNIRYLVWFESSVISYGSKTSPIAKSSILTFESSVISYGSKTQKSQN